jgi:leucyl-tRNA synthetase
LVTENQHVFEGIINEDTVTDPSLIAIRQQTHKTIAAVTDDIERFHYNKAIARIRELTNALGGLDTKMADAYAVFKESITAVIHLIAPFLPHIAEEMWQQMGNDDLVCNRPWPKANASLIVDNVVTIVIQINGKRRDDMQMPKDADSKQVETEALSLPSIVEALKGKEVKKIVVVPNRIVNVVAA